MTSMKSLPCRPSRVGMALTLSLSALVAVGQPLLGTETVLASVGITTAGSTSQVTYRDTGPMATPFVMSRGTSNAVPGGPSNPISGGMLSPGSLNASNQLNAANAPLNLVDISTPAAQSWDHKSFAYAMGNGPSFSVGVATMEWNQPTRASYTYTFEHINKTAQTEVLAPITMHLDPGLMFLIPTFVAGESPSNYTSVNATFEHKFTIWIADRYLWQGDPNNWDYWQRASLVDQGQSWASITQNSVGGSGNGHAFTFPPGYHDHEAGLLSTQRLTEQTLTLPQFDLLPSQRLTFSMTMEVAAVAQGDGPPPFLFVQAGDPVSLAAGNAAPKVLLQSVAAPIPEPGSWLLMLAGLAGLAGLLRHRKRGLAALGLAASFALSAQASCPVANRVIAIPADFSNPHIAAGALKVNLDPLGCHDILPLIIDAGGRLDNHAGLSNQLGSSRGPNNLGGLFVNGLLDNKAGANIDNSGEFYVDSRFAAGVGTVINDGAFINQGLFDMWGTFTTGSQGSFIHQGGSFRSGGQFSSAGSFENKASVSIVGGSLTNTGLLTNRGSIAVSEVVPNFVNAGVIDNLAGASLTIDAQFGYHDFTGGTLNNAGLFSNRSGLALGSPTGGIVNMLAGSLIEGTPITLFEGHTQVNAGRLRMNDSLTVWGSLQNEGVLDIHTESAMLGYPGGVASLVNNKTLNVGGNEFTTYFAGKLTNAATLVNNDRMLIDVTGKVVNGVVDVNFGQMYGRFDNNGQLRNLGSLRNFGSMSNNNEFYNAGLFISTGELINQGSIINQGTAQISGTFALEGPFENRGTVVFETGSVTQGNGAYTQVSGMTQLNGDVDVRLFEVYGGELCGKGFLKGSLVVQSSTLCPGNSPGSLHIGGDLDFLSGTLRLEIAGPGAGAYDQLQIDGFAYFSDQVQIEIALLDGYVPQAGTQWAMFSFEGGSTGFAGLAVKVSGAPSGFAFVFDNSGSLTASIAPVPEPTSLALLLAGLALIGLRRCKT